MSRLVDLLKQVMMGKAGMDRPGQGFGGGTQGLFGTGGQIGNGVVNPRKSLLNLGQDFNKMNSQPGGLLGNIPQSALLGSALFGQGMQGKDPFSALLPAVGQTAQLQQYMTPKKGRLISAYNPETKEVVYEYEKNIKAKGLTPVPKEIQGTAAERNYASYLKIVEEGDPMKIKIAASVFGKKGKDPMTKEEFLGSVAKNLAKSEYTDPKEISEKLPEFEKLYDEIYKTMETPTSVSTETLAVPESKDQLIDGQLYNVNGQSMKWNKKKDKFE